MVPSVSLASLMNRWIDDTSIDCGTDLAAPITTSGAPWYYGIFGGIGGIASRTLTAPLEKVKIVAQTSASRVRVLSELKRTVNMSGIRGLFAGNTANCIRVFPMASIVTFTYLNGLTYTPADNELDPMEPIYRGTVAALAGCIGQAATYPIDVIRGHLCTADGASGTRTGTGTGVLESAREIVRVGGWRALYKGLVPTLLAVGPFLACQMSTADALKSVAADNAVEVTTAMMLCISATAGITAQTIVYPLDVLRRRMQMGYTIQTATTGGAGASAGADAVASQASQTVLADKTWTALQQVVRQQGFRSLFAGIAPTYAKVIPSVAIAMTTTKTLIGMSEEWDRE